MTTTLRVALAAVAALAALASGCGSDGEGDRQGTQVVATTGILADVAAEVAGPDADVTQLIPDSADPHSFSLSAEDRLGLERADLVVANGAGLEAGVPLDTGAPVWELTDHAGELLAGEGGGGDPHVWMDPARVAAAVGSLAAALADTDPENAAGYARRAAAYQKRLRALDREISLALDAVSVPDRKLITSHDSLRYFADRYGFEVVATAFPSSGAEAEASAERLADLQAAVRQTGIAAVFSQAGDDPAIVAAAAAETGASVEPGLLVESPGEAGSYERMLRRDAELIAAALGG